MSRFDEIKARYGWCERCANHDPRDRRDHGHLRSQTEIDALWLVNQVESDSELKQTFQRLSGACAKFLGFTPQLLGGVRYDPALIDAVRKQTPLLKNTPNSPGAKDIKVLSGKIEKVRDEFGPYIASEALFLDRKEKE